MVREDLIARSMSMMLEEMYRLERKPLCSFRQNLLAKGVRIRSSRDAIIRLSVLTAEIGHRLAGVYAGPKCWGMLDGFLGSRCKIASLKFDGGGVGLGERRSVIMLEKMGWDMFLMIL